MLITAGAVACADAPPERIEIVVDTNAVAHVYAPSDEGAFFGAGYQTATDRLYQLEMIRRFALGRRAEVLGEQALGDDTLARFANLRRWGKADYDLTRRTYPQRAKLVAAWVAGINRRIDEIRSRRAPLPFGFAELDFMPERWSDVDPYMILKGAALANDKSIEFEIAIAFLSELFPDKVGAIELFRPGQPAVIVPSEQVAVTAPRAPAATTTRPRLTWEQLDDAQRARVAVFFRKLADHAQRLPRMASNNWAVAGSFTANGRPLLAGDPHLSFSFFGAPYPIHLNSKDAGGSFDVAGIAYPGTPGITLGANDHLGWAVTTALLDVTDVWEVESVEGAVRIAGELVPATYREETIVVRDPGAPVGVGREEVVTYTDVEGYGVMLPQQLLADLPISRDYLVGWTGFEARPIRWFMELNDVETLDEFEAAVERSDEMNYNFIGATADGIAYRTGVDVPDRADWRGARAPWRVLPGEDAGTLWSGAVLPPERLPRERDPARGWLASSNNDPFGFTTDGDVDNDPWYYGALFAPGYRAGRVQDELRRLVAAGAVTVEQMQALQLDTHSLLADHLLPLLAAARDRMATDPALATFRDDPKLARVIALLVDEWDRTMVRSSSGAVAFHAFMHFASELALADDILFGYDFAVELFAPFIFKIADLALRGEYPRGAEILQEGRDVILLEAARRTATYLEAQFGSVEPAAYRYGDVKVTAFKNALGAGFDLFSMPSDGGEDSVNVSANMAFDPDGARWRTTTVAVERHVVEFDGDGRPVLWYATPFRGPGEPEAPANRAALDEYLEGRYQRMLVHRDEIEASAASRIELLR